MTNSKITLVIATSLVFWSCSKTDKTEILRQDIQARSALASNISEPQRPTKELSQEQINQRRVSFRERLESAKSEIRKFSDKKTKIPTPASDTKDFGLFREQMATSIGVSSEDLSRARVTDIERIGQKDSMFYIHDERINKVYVGVKNPTTKRVRTTDEMKTTSVVI